MSATAHQEVDGVVVQASGRLDAAGASPVLHASDTLGAETLVQGRAPPYRCHAAACGAGPAKAKLLSTARRPLPTKRPAASPGRGLAK